MESKESQIPNTTLGKKKKGREVRCRTHTACLQDLLQSYSSNETVTPTHAQTQRSEGQKTGPRIDPHMHV